MEQSDSENIVRAVTAFKAGGSAAPHVDIVLRTLQQMPCASLPAVCMSVFPDARYRTALSWGAGSRKFTAASLNVPILLLLRGQINAPIPAAEGTERPDLRHAYVYPLRLEPAREGTVSATPAGCPENAVAGCLGMAGEGVRQAARAAPAPDNMPFPAGHQRR